MEKKNSTLIQIFFFFYVILNYQLKNGIILIHLNTFITHMKGYLWFHL